MNRHNVSEPNNCNSIVSTQKRYGIDPNRSEMKYNGLQDGVEIDVMLPVSTLNKYANMKYNNQHDDLWRNCNISTLKTYQF